MMPFTVSAQDLPFGNGESLTYAVCYRAKIVPKTPVGRATLVCHSSQYGGVPHFKIVATARTLPFFRNFYDLNDVYTSYLDSTTLRPSKLNVKLYEDGYRFSSNYLYDWRTNRVYTSYKKARWTEYKRKTMHITRNSFDALALFYNLRTIDFTSLRPGVRHNLSMVLEDTVRNITYWYVGKDVTNVKNVGNVASLKFQCSIATSTGESFKDGSVLSLWISDDRNRIPLLIQTPVRVGSVGAYLTDFSNLKYEFQSIRK